MKSNKFLMAAAAIAAVAVSSCTQNEELVALDSQFGENAVSFGTYVGSRAEQLMNNEKLQETGFGVIASYTAQDAFGDTSLPNFMYNQHVTYNGTTWEYTPVKYWPNNGGDKVSFFAYAPFTSEFGTTGITGLSANTAAGDPTLSYVMDTDAAKHTDVLYAVAQKDLTKQAIDGVVKLQFKHAMSRITFERELLVDGVANTPAARAAGDLAAETTVTINSVTFSSAKFGVSGTLNLNDGTWKDVTTGKIAYVLGTSDFVENSNVITNANKGVAQLSKDESSLMIIPVAKDDAENGSNGSITIDYNVVTTDANLDGGESDVHNTITVPFNMPFESGKSYKFLLRVGLTSVKLSAEVLDWETGEVVEWENTEF